MKDFVKLVVLVGAVIWVLNVGHDRMPTDITSDNIDYGQHDPGALTRLTVSAYLTLNDVKIDDHWIYKTAVVNDNKFETFTFDTQWHPVGMHR
jgi:hypothetical protein